MVCQASRFPFAAGRDPIESIQTNQRTSGEKLSIHRYALRLTAYVAHSTGLCGGRTPDKVRYGRRLRLPRSLIENCRLSFNRFRRHYDT